MAPNFNSIWSECPYKGGYDYSIGTSERGTSVVDNDKFGIPSFNHLLVVFGGVMGLVRSFKNWIWFDLMLFYYYLKL